MNAATQYGNRSARRYLADSLGTASPSTLLVLVYDRLVLDLQRAEQAQLTGDRHVAHENLLHAQAIVSELQNSLDVDAWDGGQDLLSLYTWVLQELVAANVGGDAARTASCRTTVIEPLAEAWREAALMTSAGGQGAAGFGA